MLRITGGDEPAAIEHDRVRAEHSGHLTRQLRGRAPPLGARAEDRRLGDVEDRQDAEAAAELPREGLLVLAHGGDALHRQVVAHHDEEEPPIVARVIPGSVP